MHGALESGRRAAAELAGIPGTVLVFGAGLAGLAAARDLVDAGRDVIGGSEKAGAFIDELTERAAAADNAETRPLSGLLPDPLTTAQQWVLSVEISDEFGRPLGACDCRPRRG